MEEKTEKRDIMEYDITIKIDAKRQVYGEFTVKAHTFEELQKRLAETKALLLKQL